MAQAKLAPRVRVEDQTRWRILVAAAERFADHGYAATSIRDIARDVGVTVGAIYVHFPSKDRLLVAVSERASAASARPSTRPSPIWMGPGNGSPRQRARTWRCCYRTRDSRA